MTGVIGAGLLTLMLLGCTIGNVPSSIAQRQAMELVDQGTQYLRQADLDRAEAAFSVAYQLHRSSAALDGLGCVSFLRGDAVQAEKLFIQAYQADESYYNSLANLALLYESRGLYSQARATYRLAIREDPANFRARNNLAGLMFEGRNSERRAARHQLLKAQALARHPLIEKNLVKLEDP